MLSRVFLIFAGILSFSIVCFFGYQLIHNQHTLSPEAIFNQKDKQLCIINHASEVNFENIEFNYPSKEKTILKKLIQTPYFSERIYISNARNRIVIELKQNWSKRTLHNYLKKKKIQFNIKSDTYVLEKNFYAYFIENYLLIGTEKVDVEHWDALNWPKWDKLASWNVLNFEKNNTSTAIYSNKNNTIAYQSVNLSHKNIQKVNDFDVFAHVIPNSAKNYHFLEKNFATYIGEISKDDLLFQWCDKGFVQFEFEGSPVIISDFSSIDPFDLLNEETEEEEIVSGTKSEYEGISISKNFPATRSKHFYIKYIDDKVVLSENKEVLNQVLAYYETGRTLALTSKIKKLIFENLPSLVCERFINATSKFTSSINAHKLIQVYKKNELNTSSEKEISTQKYETKTITSEQEIKAIIGKNEQQYCWTDNKLFALKNGKKNWSISYEGDLIGLPSTTDILNDNDEFVLFTTSKKIYLINSSGKTYAGFPISLSQKPSSEAILYTGKKETQLAYTSCSNELIKFNKNGKKLKSLKLSISPSDKPIFTYKDGKNRLGVITGKNGGQLIQLENLKKINSFGKLNETSVFCATSKSPALFYYSENKLIRNEFSGKTKTIEKFNSIKLLRTLSNTSHSYITFIADGNFFIHDEFGKNIRTIKLPTQNITDYKIITLLDGVSIVAFLDTIENSIYVFTTQGKCLTETPLEGKEMVCLSELDDFIVVSTTGNNLIIQYKISK
jgi:hypothetical protein